MPYLEIEDARIWYDVRGAGTETAAPATNPVLMLPGLGGNHTQWNLLVSQLTSRYRCIVTDFRGTGSSELAASGRDPERYTLGRLADDCLAIADALDIGNLHLVGSSMGGFIAQLFALHHPDRIASLSLHSTWTRARELARVRLSSWIRLLEQIELSEFLRHLAPWIWSDHTLEHDRERIDAFRKTQRSRGASIDREVYLLQLQAARGASTADRLGTISCPVFVTAGSEDILIPAAESRMIHEAIRASSYVEFPRCGHASFIEAQDEFNRAQLRFLDSLGTE